MTSFKLNIGLLDENIANYKEQKNKCILDIETVYRSLENTDSGWNDANTAVFMKIVREDKDKIDDYFKGLDLLYKQIEKMKIEFENLLFKYGYNKKGTLKFNDENYSLCIKALNSALEYLDRALYYVNCCNFKLGIAMSDKVYVLRSEIKKIRIEITSIIEQIKSFRNAILKILNDNKHGISKVGTVNLDIKPIVYNFNTKDIDSDLINVVRYKK